MIGDLESCNVMSDGLCTAHNQDGRLCRKQAVDEWDRLRLAHEDLKGESAKLRVGQDQLVSETIFLKTDLKDANDEVAKLNLQIEEARKVIRDAHLSGWSRGLGACVCKWCIEKRSDSAPKCVTGGEPGPNGAWIGGVWSHELVPTCLVCGVRVRG